MSVAFFCFCENGGGHRPPLQQCLSSGPFLLRCAKCVNCFSVSPSAGVACGCVGNQNQFRRFPDKSSAAGFHSTLAGGGRPGDWKIVMDEVPSAFAPLTSQMPAFNRRGVLAQLSLDPTDDRFPMLIYDKETFKDFKLTTQFKIVGGGLSKWRRCVSFPKPIKFLHHPRQRIGA